MNEYCVPFVGGIIERIHHGKRQLLVQTRFHPRRESIYNGTLEFTAGVLDKPYENVFDAIAREITEETGLTLKRIIGEDNTEVYSPRQIDGAFGFRPFCCVQQLRHERPWVGFIFRCEVEAGELTDQEGETKDVRWMDFEEVHKLFLTAPGQFFTLELPAWQYYFEEIHE